MKLSIITVCHKSSAHIADYVCSFLRYNAATDMSKSLEFILVENSGDEAIESLIQPLIDSGFSAVVIKSGNQGFGAACNLGAKSAKGTRLAFVNPDILFHTSLGPLLDYSAGRRWGSIRQTDGSGGAYCIDYLPEFKGSLSELLKGYRLINIFPKFFLSKAFIVGSFFWVDEEVFKEVGMFNERFFLYYEEAELSRRLHGISPPEILRDIEILHVGLGSHVGQSAARRHQWNGFVTYCQVTGQPELLRKRLATLKRVGRFSPAAAQSYTMLRELIANADDGA